MNLTFWTSILSPHLAPVIRELSRSNAVTVVTTEGLQSDLVTLGWKESPIEGIEWIRASNASDIRAVLSRHDSSTGVHLIGGLRGYNLATTIQREVARRGSRIGIVSERPDTRGAQDYVRRAIYFLQFLRLRNHVDFFLAMGMLGQEYFIARGWPASKVFPYAYVTEDLMECLPENGVTEPDFHVIFVGRFTRRKGGDILLRALAKLKSHSWRCSFIGAGDRLESWQELARDTGIARQVEFVPPVNMGEIPKLMSNADLLVLPSRFDGWGAVVNEAIIAGVPAICSSACGARDLISESRGEVFETENVEGLAAALRRRFEQGPVSADERMKLRRWSECISGQAMAQYLTDILAHIYHGGPRPDAPWLTQAVTGGDTVAAGQARLRSS